MPCLLSKDSCQYVERDEEDGLLREATSKSVLEGGRFVGSESWSDRPETELDTGLEQAVDSDS